ncbi:hypothetical protein BKA69DRAFT_1044491 [Paraphysoderma sedebokerense]|nr:hypothetical protein BKA69DRAFT_1044491 [Paraphysoderma sedebokerense]
MELMYKKQVASEVSLKLMALENRAEPWKNLQFNHVKWFPKGECSLCYSQICFSCGEPTHHNHQSCLEYRRLKIKNLELSESGGSPDIIQTEKWVLENR